MQPQIKALAGIFLTGVLALPAHASLLFLSGDSNIFTTAEDNEVFFQNIFNDSSVVSYGTQSLSSLGTTAAETYLGSSEVTSAGLSGKDFMMYGLNLSHTPISGGELTAITDYYNGGGSLFLYGDGNSGFAVFNQAINAILSAVGSSMSLSTTDNFDDGFFTVLTDFVGSGTYAAGVNSWTTAFASTINLGSGQAVISGIADTGEFGTAIGLEGDATTPPTNVPAPSTFVLFGLGLAGLGWSRRKRV